MKLKYKNEKISECAVVPLPDKIKGQVPIAFAVLKKGNSSKDMEKVLKKYVDKN